jgi:hypothetical protein
MEAGDGEQKCVCNLQQEKSKSDFYKRCAKNTSDSRKNRSPQSTDCGGGVRTALPKRVSVLIWANLAVRQNFLMAVPSN